jgi:hypothetical protein
MTVPAWEFGAVDAGAFVPVGPDGVAVARDAGGGLGVSPVAAGGAFVACVKADRRGLVLEVGPAENVHVNGRPVREWSLLRSGDILVISRRSFLVRACRAPEPAGDAAIGPREASARQPAAWLRCVGGRQSGQIRPVSSATTLPWPGGRGVLATVGNESGKWVVRAASTADLMVDGHPVSACILRGGEQLAVGEGRWVLECSGATDPEPSSVEVAAAPASEIEASPINDGAIAPVSNPGARFSPLWLLIAALGVAAALVGLLWSMR